jgi:formylglycine-generating enzyme required for sulfatase activity
MQPLARFWAHPMVRVALAITGLGLLTLAVLRFALAQRQPDRCPAGMVALEDTRTEPGRAPVQRCCGVGQTVEGGVCSGRAKSCATTQDLNARGECVARFGVVSLPGGELFIGAADWEGQTGGDRFPRTRVEPFRIDVAEVTRDRYQADQTYPSRLLEPGGPVIHVTATEADAFCKTQGGRLPTSAEWIWAAAGPAARRYAWGNSGLVCRRAVYGMLEGPCAENGLIELVGSRPDGASPEGVLDLAGNVAEWTLEADGRFCARGGSAHSTAAAQLKTWAAEACGDGSFKASHLGFRCAYSP